LQQLTRLIIFFLQTIIFYLFLVEDRLKIEDCEENG